MKIHIKYKASWSNSFLDGSNDNVDSIRFNDKKKIWEKKDKRKYNCSTASLKQINETDITHNTVMGILNLLIGDQRKLWQSRLKSDYFYSGIEQYVTFANKCNKTNEVVYLANKDRSADQSRLKKSVNDNEHAVFNSSYSNELWSILYMNIDELYDFIVHDIHNIIPVDCDSVTILKKLSSIEKTMINIDEKIISIYDIYINIYRTMLSDDCNVEDELKPFILTDRKTINLNRLYFIALFKKAKHLQLEAPIVTRKGEIAGLYVKLPLLNQFTKVFNISGSPRTVKGNPYMVSPGKNKILDSAHTLSKKDGELTINIAVDDYIAQTIKDAIEQAAVSTFYVGKKGLAYVDYIE
jgi:hypothetical protein